MTGCVSTRTQLVASPASRRAVSRSIGPYPSRVAGASLTPVIAYAQTPPFAGVRFQSDGKPVRGILYQPQGTPRGSGIVMMHGSGGGIRSQGPWHDLATRFA